MLIGLTLLSLLPAILLSCTAFTKIFVVLGLTRNALGLQQTPPNQVLAGLALFLSLFVMGPVLSEINDVALQPYLNGDMTPVAGAATTAWSRCATSCSTTPRRRARADDQRRRPRAARQPGRRRRPTTLIPAFVLSELKPAFIIGFVIFIPFLVIDLVVSGSLMSLGMMMLPPVMVSLPFKLLLFVLVDGWGLVIKSLVASYGT